MHVCFCVHRLPYPPIAGGRTETFKLIEGLAGRGHDLSVVSYGDDSEAAAEMEEAIGCDVDLVAGQPNRTAGNLAGNLLSIDPLPVTKSRSERYEHAVDLKRTESDILHLHAIQTSFLADRQRSPEPTVMRFNNVKYPIYRQYARRGTRNPAKAAYAYLQSVKAKRYERALPEAADLTLTITEEDRELLAATERADVQVLPAGVDLDRHQPAAAGEDGVITFFGSMDYHPNVDAVRWFANRVFPRIRDRLPDSTFEIVGKRPPTTVEKLGRQEGITVTGFVEDINEYIDRASVIVIPIRVGTGVRMKVLHAMALAKPVVSTPLGVQGIRAEDGTHVAIADSDETFATRTVGLLEDPVERNRLGTNARRLMAEDHDWRTIIGRLEDHYEDLLATKGSTV